MVEYICPECHGGFDRPRYEGDDGYCPWCAQPLDGSYEYEPMMSITERNQESPKRLLDIFR